MKLKLTLSFLMSFALLVCSHAQVSPVVKLEEDYSKPEYYMWKKGDEYHNRYIENGMYVGKQGSVLPAELSFPYEIGTRQGKFTSVGDMEFTIVKLKGKPEDFIFIHIYSSGNSDIPYLNFAYNELGEWQLGNYLFETVYKSGETKVKEDTNVVRIEYRYRKLRYFINGIPVTDFEFKDVASVTWADVKIEAMRKQKTVIGLDKVMFAAYTGDVPFSDDAKKAAAEAAIPKYRTVPEQSKGLKFITFAENGKMGIMNNSGLVIVPAKYEEIGRLNEEFDPFENGFTRVKINGHYGFIDSTGKAISKMYYDDAHFSFSEGLAAVSTGKWGYINTKGETVLPHEYTYAAPFSEGFATVSKTPDDGMSNFANQGAIDKTGKTVIEFKYEELGSFVDGLAPFFTKENSKFGFMDKTGKVVIPQSYDFTEGFDPDVHGYAVVNIDKPNGSGGTIPKWGVIDKTGKIIIPIDYKYVHLIDYNLVYVQIDNTPKSENESKTLTWLMDFSGKQLSKKYEEIYLPFNSGGLVGVILVNKQGFIDKSGKEIIPVIYDLDRYALHVYFTDGFVELELNGKKVKFDNTGKEVK